MELFIFIIFVAFIIFIAAALSVKKQDPHQAHDLKYAQYHYYPKSLIMTKYEASFFRRLETIVGARYYVFPQVHLSALLGHKVKGQDWKGAFRHINGKSVDYVLCAKDTLKPVYAVELDDYTHNYERRAYRDMEVEMIFEDAGVPLVRFKEPEKMSDTDIANSLAHAKTLTESATKSS